jgi:hypothetical protein
MSLEGDFPPFESFEGLLLFFMVAVLSSPS